MPSIRTIRQIRSLRRRGENRTESGVAPTVITAHFLRQIEAAHVRTPTQGRPIPLQFCYTTQGLSEWAWYVTSFPSTANTLLKRPGERLGHAIRTAK